MRKLVIFLTICWPLTLLSNMLYANTPSEAATFNLATIAPAIKEFVRAKLAEQYDGEIVIELLQKDLALKQCQSPLNYVMAEHTIIGSRSTVKVSCELANPWSIYIPVSIKIYQPIVITNRPMSKDEKITQEVLSLKNIDITNLNQGFFSDPTLVIGHVMRVAVKAGNVLSPALIAKAKLIKRGDRVNITAEDAELSVYMQGESLEDGGLGDNIKIRNLSSKRIIEATVIASGKVKVTI